MTGYQHIPLETNCYRVWHKWWQLDNGRLDISALFFEPQLVGVIDVFCFVDRELHRLDLIAVPSFDFTDTIVKAQEICREPELGKYLKRIEKQEWLA